MPLVDCDCDAEWADYLNENYTLAHFAHLRPSGFVRLPAYEWPSDRSCEVILSGPPGCGKEAVLAALEGPGGFALHTHDSFYSHDQFLRRWSHRRADGEHVVTTLLGKNRELSPPECFAYRYTLNSVFDRARAGVNFSDDISQEEIVALVEELTDLTTRRRVWAFYLRGTPAETYARLGPGAGPFDAHMREHADADSFYTTAECPHVTSIWTDGKTADAVKDEILERVKTFMSN